MEKNYTADLGHIKIFDDMFMTIEIKIDADRYIAHKTTVDTICAYSCKRMDDVNHNDLNISKETNCYPDGKLDAINLILKYAGERSYQTLIKAMKGGKEL